jgi:transposase-like protein
MRQISDEVVSPCRGAVRRRRVCAVSPVVFIDCVHVKVRDGQVANRPAYMALAVTAEGTRDLLGLWGGEGAKYWRTR